MGEISLDEDIFKTASLRVHNMARTIQLAHGFLALRGGTTFIVLDQEVTHGAPSGCIDSDQFV